MTTPFPYTLISCPCDSEDELPATAIHARRTTISAETTDEDEAEADKTLNPHDPRSNFSLYPYTRLLYCDECHQIRCPKCWAEETTNWYCPSCLFEVPSSVVKNDGNRCTRNCYNCPLCTSPLSINALDQQASSADASGLSGPFFLGCPCCEWSSLDVGIELSKPSKITEQLLRLRKHDSASTRPAITPETGEAGSPHLDNPAAKALDPVFRLEHKFNQLSGFYKDQLSTSDAGSTNSFGLDASYSSPSNLARIMQIYGGLSASSLKKAKEKPRPMREALIKDEGLLTFMPQDGSTTTLFKTDRTFLQIATFEQRSSHPWNHNVELAKDLWPVPALLKTKTSKRCRACRHILIRHDDSRSKTSSGSSSTSSAISSGKYKIRLLAQNRVPRLSLRSFNSQSLISAATPLPRAAFALTATALQTIKETEGGMGAVRPFQTKQFLLMVVNPLFETVRVTLASPQTTPGKVESRVTILCPTFEIGADGDMWDSALDTSGSASSRSRTDAGTPRDKGGLAGGAGQYRGRVSDDAELPVPEAGKVWERGRNWVAVIVEVVPGALPESEKTEKLEEDEDYDEWVKRCRMEKRKRTLRDDVLEIPVFVKAEWEADSAGEEAGATPVTPAGSTPGGGKAVKVKREIGFWCVLGAGRIVP